MENEMTFFGDRRAVVIVLRYDTNGVEQLSTVQVTSVLLILWGHPCSIWLL
jgi:hypothetical protein